METTATDVLNTFSEALWAMALKFIFFPFFCVFLCILILFVIRQITRKRSDEYQGREDYAPSETLTREEIKGQRGEDLIEQILYDAVPGEFQIFRNAYVPNGNSTAEIDLLMVHETGIFVFESKNYGGWIYGSLKDLNWTQMFPSQKKISFYNPVRQNENHIKALSQYLQIPESDFYSYVVFSDRCELKKVPNNTRSMFITQSSDLETELNRMLSALPSRYDEEEIQAIADRLVPLTNVDPSVKEKHIADIRAAQESEICPFCGKRLVLREGRYGSFFWGCSSYPKCKFTRKVSL